MDNSNTSNKDYLKDTSFKIPDDAVLYILFQRTAYLIVQNNIFWNRFLIRIPFLTYNRYVAIEAFLGRNRIKRLFAEDIRGEYERVKNHLPPKAESILDIGCGVAGIDVFLNRHYSVSPPSFYLLDKTEIEPEVYYDLKPKASFYNSLAIAGKILEENGVKSSRIHTEEVNDKNEIKFNAQFDLVISLISWGFHYPVDTYLNQVYDLLNPGGTIIIDVRRGRGGEEALRKKFPDAKIIYSAQKHDRFVAQK